MPRRPRADSDGELFHVMNRGIARRTMFERTSDYRYFLSRLAHACRREEIEVVAYVLMTTHFHLLLRSRGKLSRALQRIQGEYTRTFNRGRKRDGALQRGRFYSKLVHSDLYLENLIPYIDENPVQARMAETPSGYPWSSAGARARGWHGPWLSDEFANWSIGASTAEEMRHRSAFIEARFRSSASGAPLDNLVGAVPDQVARWMRRKAHLADGTEPGLPIAGAETVLDELDATAEVLAEQTLRLPGCRVHPLRDLCGVGLLRELSGEGIAAIARRLRMGDSRARRMLELHVRALGESDAYCDLVGRVTAACLAWLRPGGVENRRIRV